MTIDKFWIPREIRRAVDAHGVTLSDLIDPTKVETQIGTAHMAVTENGETLAVVPLHRLGMIDPLLIRDHLDYIARHLLPVSVVARMYGVGREPVTRHRVEDHDTDPEWHAKRAAWWIAELAALKGETA